MDAPKIFVSYAREDRDWAERLVNALRTKRFEVWWDIEIPTGEDFGRVIEGILSNVHAVIVLWTENSVESDWVRTEAAYALEEKKLLPIRAEGKFTLPIQFRYIQTHDMAMWDGSADAEVFCTLVRDLEKLFGVPQFVPRDTLSNGKKAPELVRIPAGEFLMGSPESEPGHRSNEAQHPYKIETFLIGKYPVTFGEFDAFCEACNIKKPYDRDWGRRYRPVVNISLESIWHYLDWLSELTNKEYRLPTEAEWDYAARAGSTTRFWWGDTFNANGVHCSTNQRLSEKDGTTKVGSYEPNRWGLYDSAGNVWEWTSSSYALELREFANLRAPRVNSLARTVKGGSWLDLPYTLRSAYRIPCNADRSCATLGFRVVRSA